MRSKVEKPATVPLKYRRYKASDWPEGGWGEYVEAREAWNASQEPVTIAGQHHDGRRFAYTAGPLGDLTDLIRARREARLIDITAAYAGDQVVSSPRPIPTSEPEPVESQ